ncbi:MAG: cardiolipin synthase [Pirellulales bacterium]|nr:cardiolipin synthase [Pirellulales bacterium]
MLFSEITHPLGYWFFWAHLIVQLVLSFRVVMQRRQTGETLAWIMVIWVFPVIGPLFYLIFGELRLGKRRAKRFTEMYPPIRKWLAEIPQRSLVDWSRLDPDFESLSEMGERTIGVPSLRGNAVVLISDWHEVFDRIIADINAAQTSCHFEFYIWTTGGRADEVVDALIAAAQRGVVCRVLVDAMGSRGFLKSDAVQRMRDADVMVTGALPGGLLRLPFVRFDLRLHRKIVVIDGRVAYTGSLNLVDPRYFKRDSGVGQWIDAMVRMEGPAVEALAITFLADWFVETDTPLSELQSSGDAHPQPSRGDCAVQVMPSGPGLATRAVEQVLITAIYSAREELVLTTPYFVPSEPLSLALIAAARRGVKVVLVLPARVDSKLVRYASGAFKVEMLEAGVKIAAFNDGLLHTKSVTIDGTHSLFGSVNLDPRSMRLNFEILLAVYNADFTTRLRALQQQYIDQSQLLDLETYQSRPQVQQTAENFARLLSPLL